MSNEVNKSVRSDDQIDKFRNELADYLKEIAGWSASADVLQQIASMHARAAQIRHWLHGQNSPRATNFRKNEVYDFIQTCDFQFRVYSRLEAVRQSEMSMTRGY